MTDDEIVASWNRGGGDAYFGLVASRFVDDDVRKGAEAGQCFATVHLGLEDLPPMRFYTP